MRSLISLLIIVLVVFALSKLLLGSGAGNHVESSDGTRPRSQSAGSTSSHVRDSINSATSKYQRNLEQSMEDAGVERTNAQ